MVLYYVRHQAEGVCWRYPFLSPPSEAQQAAIGALCAASHGESHPKTNKKYWVEIVEIDALNEGELPPPPKAEEKGDGVPRIGLPPIVMHGVGHVENPKEG